MERGVYRDAPYYGPFTRERKIGRKKGVWAEQGVVLQEKAYEAAEHFSDLSLPLHPMSGGEIAKARKLFPLEVFVFSWGGVGAW